MKLTKNQLKKLILEAVDLGPGSGLYVGPPETPEKQQDLALTQKALDRLRELERKVVNVTADKKVKLIKVLDKLITMIHEA